MLVLEKAVFKIKNVNTISRIPGLQAEIAYQIRVPFVK
jgi:hypothetical protein